MNIREKAKQIKRDLPAVFLALKHKDTPLLAKMLSAVAVCYALSPIDLIPDFIPVLGYLDDVLILPVLIVIIIKLVPKEVFEECRNESEGLWKDGKPERWYYALPIVLIYILVIYFIVMKIRG